jgi:hypothetical protein
MDFDMDLTRTWEFTAQATSMQQRWFDDIRSNDPQTINHSYTSKTSNLILPSTSLATIYQTPKEHKTKSNHSRMMEILDKGG